MNDWWFCVVFVPMALIDLLFQWGRRRELCTELKIHRIKEIRLSKEIRLKDYIFFSSYGYLFHLCFCLRNHTSWTKHGGTLACPLCSPQPITLQTSWQGLIQFPYFFLEIAFVKSRSLENAVSCFLAPLYPALSLAGSFSEETGLDDFACMSAPESLCSIFFRTQAGIRNIFMTCVLYDDVTDSSSTCE